MRRAPPLADVARVAHRLAVLLGAGVAPGAAWEFVAESTSSIVVHAVAGEADAALAIERAIEVSAPDERRAWAGLAAAWSVAVDSGSPLAGTLRDYAVSLRALSDVERDAEVALASPRATARIVLVLPVIGVLFGALLGFGTVGVLLTTPIGWGCIAVGGGLLLTARYWNARLVAAARPRSPTPGLDCDLFAIAVGGGVSVDRAREAVRRAVERFGLDGEGRERAENAVRLAVRAGVPVADLLRAEAEEARRDARADAQRRAAELAVRLMAPLGVCVLPAFLVLGVVPLMVAVLSSTVGVLGG